MTILVAAGLGFLLTLIMLPFVLKLLQEAGATRSNYRGESIPVGMGLIFVFVYVVVAFLLVHWIVPHDLLLYLTAIVFFTMLGLLDDLLGSGESRGLKGHFGALLQGRLTTGALKAIGGGLVALLFAFITLSGRPWWEILTAALLVALAANTINLVDLRPGRAIKVFYLWFFVLFGFVGFGYSQMTILLLAPLAGGLLACASADLNAKGMLGDTGANLMGAALGMASVWTMAFSTQLAVVVFLLLLHFFTEKYSLTEIIEKNSFLRYLDNLGRGK
jgi:UDP-GlcNAc:undecaprenyl-phosphate GlcNAc-1-phosphate transferase